MGSNSVAPAVSGARETVVASSPEAHLAAGWGVI